MSTDNSLARVVDEAESKQLDEFRDRIKNEKNLLCPMEDIFLLRFLRYMKNDVDRALEAILKSWRDVDKIPELHEGLYPSAYAHLYPNKFSTTFAKRDHLGRQVILWKPANFNPKETLFLDQMKSNFCLVDEISSRQLTQLNGMVVLMDLSGLGLNHVQAFTPYNLKLLLYLVDGFPVRVKGIHFINYPMIFNIVYTCAKGFMKPKMKKRLHFHSNYKSLHEHLGPEILPKKYGGILNDDEFEEPDFIKKVLDRDDWFKDITNNYGFKKTPEDDNK